MSFRLAGLFLASAALLNSDGQGKRTLPFGNKLDSDGFRSFSWAEARSLFSQYHFPFILTGIIPHSRQP